MINKQSFVTGMSLSHVWASLKATQRSSLFTVFRRGSVTAGNPHVQCWNMWTRQEVGGAGACNDPQMSSHLHPAILYWLFHMCATLPKDLANQMNCSCEGGAKERNTFTGSFLCGDFWASCDSWQPCVTPVHLHTKSLVHQLTKSPVHLHTKSLFHWFTCTLVHQHNKWPVHHLNKSSFHQVTCSPVHLHTKPHVHQPTNSPVDHCKTKKKTKCLYFCLSPWRQLWPCNGEKWVQVHPSGKCACGRVCACVCARAWCGGEHPHAALRYGG